jgi:hypothetical protein
VCERERSRGHEDNQEDTWDRDTRSEMYEYESESRGQAYTSVSSFLLLAYAK